MALRCAHCRKLPNRNMCCKTSRLWCLVTRQTTTFLHRRTSKASVYCRVFKEKPMVMLGWTRKNVTFLSVLKEKQRSRPSCGAWQSLSFFLNFSAYLSRLSRVTFSFWFRGFPHLFFDTTPVTKSACIKTLVPPSNLQLSSSKFQRKFSCVLIRKLKWPTTSKFTHPLCNARAGVTSRPVLFSAWMKRSLPR